VAEANLKKQALPGVDALLTEKLLLSQSFPAGDISIVFFFFPDGYLDEICRTLFSSKASTFVAFGLSWLIGFNVMKSACRGT